MASRRKRLLGNPRQSPARPAAEITPARDPPDRAWWPLAAARDDIFGMDDAVPVRVTALNASFTRH